MMGGVEIYLRPTNPLATFTVDGLFRGLKAPHLSLMSYIQALQIFLRE